MWWNCALFAIFVVCSIWFCKVVYCYYLYWMQRLCDQPCPGIWLSACLSVYLSVWIGLCKKYSIAGLSTTARFGGWFISKWQPFWISVTVCWIGTIGTIQWRHLANICELGLFFIDCASTVLASAEVCALLSPSSDYFILLICALCELGCSV